MNTMTSSQSIDTLTFSEAKRWSTDFSPDFNTAFLAKRAPNEPSIRIGLFDDDTCIAAALFYKQLDGRAKLVSFSAHEAWRNPETFESLIGGAVEMLQKETPDIEIFAEIEADSTVAGDYEKLLPQMGFGQGTITGEAFRGCVGDEVPDLWRGWTGLPEGFSTVPWHSLKQAQIQHLATVQLDEWQVPYALNPFRDLQTLDNLTSLALCDSYHEVAGWIVNHQWDDSTIRYGSVFVKPELQETDFALPLLTRSIMTHVAEAASSRSKWVFHIPNEKEAMLRIVSGKFASHTTERAQILKYVFE